MELQNTQNGVEENEKLLNNFVSIKLDKIMVSFAFTKL